MSDTVTASREMRAVVISVVVNPFPHELNPAREVARSSKSHWQKLSDAFHQSTVLDLSVAEHSQVYLNGVVYLRATQPSIRSPSRSTSTFSQARSDESKIIINLPKGTVLIISVFMLGPVLNLSPLPTTTQHPANISRSRPLSHLASLLASREVVMFSATVDFSLNRSRAMLAAKFRRNGSTIQ